jgi:hypothetical protein
MLSHQKYGTMVFKNFNISNLLFVFSFCSQNTQSSVKVEISIAQKNKYFHVVYVIIFPEYFTLPDDGFLKKLKYVAINYTARYHQILLLL